MKSILFLCVANSARSQIAEGLAKQVLGAGFSIQSAGSKPSGKIHAMAIQVLKEVGVDPSEQFSKSLDEINLDLIDLVVTLCAEEVCPVIAKQIKKLHWPIPDPASVQGAEEEQLKAFRQARDTIQLKLLQLKIID